MCVYIYIFICIYIKHIKKLDWTFSSCFSDLFLFNLTRRFLRSGTLMISQRSGSKRNCPSFAEI